MSVQAWKLALAPRVWRLLRRSLRFQEFQDRAAEKPPPLIFACLHRDILPAILFVRSVRPTLLVSNSLDGDILIRALGQVDYRFVRGATGADGGRAFVALKRELAAGHSVGLAVDGPVGPFGAIHPGVVQLAKATGVPILPLVAVVPGAFVLGTWDRTVVPRPFSRFEIQNGPAICLQPDASAGDLQAALDELAVFFAVPGVPV
jgi:lysophospholipid acyltransferase (LPLAT)-like uncharacterized protein